MTLCGRNQMSITRFIFFASVILLGLSQMPVPSQTPTLGKSASALRVFVVLQPYTGHRRGPELSPGPNIVYKSLAPLFLKLGIQQAGVKHIQLSPDEEKQYGVWHRLGLADGHLGRTIAAPLKEGSFVLGLLGNCNSLMGMLAGLQHSGSSSKPINSKQTAQQYHNRPIEE